MALKKTCLCGKIIDYSLKCCEECESKKKDRHKQYDDKRKDDKNWKFYKTPAWLSLRERVLRDYNYLDLWEYYMNGVIVAANTSHHVIELRDDWSKRLDFKNQFPLSQEGHSYIHKLYEKDKEGTQQILFSLLERWRDENEKL